MGRTTDTKKQESAKRELETEKQDGGQRDGRKEEFAPRNAKQFPICLWPEHLAKGYRHYLRDLKECPKDEKDELFNKFRSEKTEGAKRTTEQKLQKSQDDTRILFYATFGGKTRATVCADIGADANNLDSAMIQAFEDDGFNLTVEILNRPLIFDMATSALNGERVSIKFTRVVVIYTELRIRQGSAVIIRGVRWLVTDQSVEEAQLGRPLLEALGLNRRVILAAAADKHSGIVDVSILGCTNSNFNSHRRIARVLEGLYHTEGGADDADLNDTDGWIDLGPQNKE